MNVWLTDCGRSADGFSEQRDCSVRALAACLNIRYSAAHAKLTALGRKPRHGIKFWKHVEALGLEQRPDLCCRTLATILPDMQAGKFIVRISGHVFAVVNGTVLDTEAPKLKCRVKMVYQPAS